MSVESIASLNSEITQLKKQVELSQYKSWHDNVKQTSS